MLWNAALMTINHKQFIQPSLYFYSIIVIVRKVQFKEMQTPYLATQAYATSLMSENLVSDVGVYLTNKETIVQNVRRILSSKRQLTRHAWPVFLGRTHLGCKRPLANLVLRADIRRRSIDLRVICVLQESLATFLSLHWCTTWVLPYWLPSCEWAWVRHTTLCPKGYYCNGTVLRPVRCPPGRTTEFFGLALCSECPIGKAGTNGTCQLCQGNSGTFEPGSTHCHRCPVGKFINAQKTFCALERRHGSASTIQYVLSDGPQRLVGWDASNFETTSKALAFFVIDKLTDQPVSSHCQLLSHRQSVH